MNGKLLKKANLSIRKTRPTYADDKVCEVFVDNGWVEIAFLSGRCYNDCNGSCIMCDYGVANGTRHDNEYIAELDRILTSFGDSIHSLLLCTNGSFFDDRQINSSLLRAILQRCSQTLIPNIDVETHYLDVTAEKLSLMKELLPDKEISVEVGLETINSVYQSSIIMKNIDMHEFEIKVGMIQSFGFHVETNIMIGLPFLSPYEQFNDALMTIQWALKHHCIPILFPINIKPYTLLMDMYKSGHYERISQWMLPLILNSINETDLASITVAWYGNREDVYIPGGERVVFPVACPICTDRILEFYPTFLKEKNGHNRKQLLSRLLSENRCECLEKARSRIAVPTSETFETRYNTYIKYLQNR